MKTLQTFQEEIAAIIADVVECEKEEVSPDTHLADELGVNSLVLIEIYFRLENTYKINFPVEQIDRWVTLRDIVDSLKEEVLFGAVE